MTDTPVESVIRAIAREAPDVVTFLGAVAELGLHPHDARRALAIWRAERPGS